MKKLIVILMIFCVALMSCEDINNTSVPPEVSSYNVSKTKSENDTDETNTSEVTDEKKEDEKSDEDKDKTEDMNKSDEKEDIKENIDEPILEEKTDVVEEKDDKIYAKINDNRHAEFYNIGFIDLRDLTFCVYDTRNDKNLSVNINPYNTDEKPTIISLKVKPSEYIGITMTIAFGLIKSDDLCFSITSSAGKIKSIYIENNIVMINLAY